MKSINRTAYLSILAIAVPTCFLIFFLFGYTIHQNNTRIYSLQARHQDAVAASLSSDVSSIKKQALSLAYSYDFHLFANSSDLRTISRRAANLLDNAITGNPEIVGIYLYNEKREWGYRLNNVVNHSDQVTLWVNSQYKKGGLEPETVFMLYEDDSQILIVIQICKRYGNLVVLIDPAKNVEFQSLQKLSADMGDLRFCAADSPNAFTADQHITKTCVDGLYIVYTHHQKGLFDSVDAVQKWTIHGVILVMLLFPLAIINLRNTLLDPLHLLSKSFAAVGGGDVQYRIDKQSQIREIAEIYTGFNTMIDQLWEATKAYNRAQVDAFQAQLQYLQLQIRPHFYLNCLKNIYSMADLNKTEEIKDLVLYLSKYFRYSFQDVTGFIPLLQELEAAKNYVDLNNCMSRRVELDMKLDSSILDGQCLPLIILTFIENCIKHGKDINLLKILLRVYRLPGKDSNDILIEVRNNGGGFQPEALDELRNMDPRQLHYGTEKVGISNVAHRLWLVYGEKAAITFANDGDDAVVLIRFPSMWNNSVNEEAKS